MRTSLSEEKLAAIKGWAVSDKFTDIECAVMQATDEIVGRNLVEDETFAVLKSHLSDEQIMELFYVDRTVADAWNDRARAASRI